MSNLNGNNVKKKFKTNRDKPDQIHNGKICVMLAHGESGHAHAFYGEDTVEFKPTGDLVVKKSDSLQHEEHSHFVVEPGIGEVIIQREYSMGKLKRVID